MRHLYFYRHAHSAHADDGQLDHDRVLTPRGEEEATQVGLHLKENGWKPDYVLCSTAVRTKATLGLTVKALGSTLETDFTNKLYLAQPGDIFRLINEVPAGVESVMVVGHNPGLYQCCMLLAQQGEQMALGRLGQGFSPASLAVFRIDAADWKEVSPATPSFLKAVLGPY